MRKNKKIVCTVISSCAILASFITVTGISTIYPQASENSGTEMAGNTNTPPSQGVPSKDEMPPEPPNGFDSTTGNRPDNLGMPPGGTSSVPTSYAAIITYTEDTEITDKTITSTDSDENAVLVQNGANVTMKNITLNRMSSNSTGGDSASFYGVGAGALVTDGVLNVSDSTIDTDSAGGTGLFAYGSGIVNVQNSKIYTKKDTSGGIHAAGGGTVNATNLTVTTEGNSSAAIRSDRGGGTMIVNGGTYTSNGSGSPAVYCTADITIKDADLIANGSEAVCIEGLNSLKLTNCNLTGNMPKDSQNDCTWNIILYQSMSGDSQIGNSNFSMEGGTLAAKNGGVFYTTNTESTFYLSNVDIQYADQNDFFLKCTGNSNARGWGLKGANGADSTLKAENQDMQGDIIWDSISKLDFNMSNGSVLTGAIVQDESNAGSGGTGYANVTIDASSKWIVTGNSTVSKLSCLGTIQDIEGNTVSILNTDGTVISKGNSAYHITVTSNYNTNNTEINNTGVNNTKTSTTKIKKSVKVGKTVRIKVDKNAKIIKVSKKKVVKAKVKGNKVIIKGNKIGKSTVTVKNQNTTYKIIVTVKS